METEKSPVAAGMSKPGHAPRPEYCLHGPNHMGKMHALAAAALGLALFAAWLVYANLPALRGHRAPEPGTGSTAAVPVDSSAYGAESGTGVMGGPTAPTPPPRADPDAVIRGDVVYEPDDLEIFQATVRWARSEAIDTLPIGPLIARLGRRFVGSPYTPHTLDLPGPERLVVNLRTFDCVTYVESMLALARVLRASRGADIPGFEAFTNQLRLIRYRNGRLDGYASRLHYFTDWIRDNQAMGLVRDITRQLGGSPVTGPIDFMSTHAAAYAPLVGHPERVARIRAVERELSSEPRYVVPQQQVAAVADRIRDGDIIAMTSTVAGLDVAHTGFAIRVGGQLHLMNAPLVGKSVEISTLPLATRILRIDGQDGIMVARPL